MADSKRANDAHGQILTNQAKLVERLLRNRVLPARANTGLVFDRYLPIWDTPANRPPQISKGGSQALQEFVTDFAEAEVEGRKHIVALQQRQERLATQLSINGALWQTEMTGSERLVIGMGVDHPLENGFTFHPLFGLPYLPGSSLKGLIRAAGTLRYGDEPPDWLEQALGTEHVPGAPSQAGDIIVLDAFPAAWPELTVEVINCHHPNYYQHPLTRKPVETESPIPVYFLAVERGAHWRIRLLRRKPSGTNLERIGELLHEGLQWLGIGGKTAVGYGRMVPQ